MLTCGAELCVTIFPQKELLSVRAELKSVREVGLPGQTAVLCVTDKSQLLFLSSSLLPFLLRIFLPLPPSLS